MEPLKYLLDTNVLSEPTKAYPNPQLLASLQQHQSSWCTCSIVWRELCYGMERMPESAKKEQIRSYLSRLQQTTLVVLPFDLRAATWLATEQARLEKHGTPPAYADGEIAAIAVTQELTLVTRNVADFSRFRGLRLENWFSS